MKYPITPEYIDAAPDAISELYIGLQDYILDYVCAQFKTGDANAKAIELVRILQRRGLDIEDIEREIKRVLRLTDREFDQIFADAIKRNEQYYGAALDKAGLLRDTFRAETMAAEMAAITAQTKGELVNITQSMGFRIRGLNGEPEFLPIAKAYQTALDKAEIKVWSGAVSYQQAVKEAVDELCTSGIQWVDYESKHHNRIDVAARRAVRTGITQISAKYSDALMEELGTDYLEVTAHGGARDIDGPSLWSNHKAWQGRVYSFKSGDIYPSVYAVCGLGYVDGLLGANCRHLYHAWIEGVSERTYTDEELENIDPPPFEFEGKEYTAYKATQMMRKLETAIRTSKRNLVGYKAADSEDAYTDESIRLRRLREEYKSFSDKSGIKEHPELLTVKEFGRKEAAQAAGRYKSVASAAEKMYDVGSERENIDAYRRDEPLRRQIREEYPRKIDKGQQRKHFEGTNEYKNYSEPFAAKGEYGPSRIRFPSAK